MFSHQILEYAPHGVLGDYLYKDITAPIPAKNRAKILLDVARGFRPILCLVFLIAPLFIYFHLLFSQAHLFFLLSLSFKIFYFFVDCDVCLCCVERKNEIILMLENSHYIRSFGTSLCSTSNYSPVFPTPLYSP